MSSYVDDVQDYLCRFEGDHGEELERLHPPYSRPFNQTRPMSSFFETAKPAVKSSNKQQRRIYEPLQQSFYQASEAFGPSLYSDQDIGLLDDYGKHSR